MSDAPSIITQVNRDGTPAHTAAGGKSAQKAKYPARRGIWSLLFCCGRGTQEAESPEHVTDRTVTESQSDYNGEPLLGPLRKDDKGRKCLVLDLDETLVHSSFRPIPNPDYIIPVEIEGIVHQVYVLKRPYVDEFLKRVGQLFECVLFTASLAKYADPVSDLLDKDRVLRSRLFRESCVQHRGNYVKDLSRLGRELSQTVIIDNSPASYAFHPDYAIPIVTWFDDKNDTALLDLIPFLEYIAKVDNVQTALRAKPPPR
ncbi:CTD small phosphatase [Capsaspora owczarzaki ATCC 30864]|uniref:protein-serine/threonine phosphatase n=1 Tax=Capsaspora owczarzaki (strain ATCC 30864) TaxID=595528 RepID=A0A0D2X343_CAPO3|nr:CTD small phosphatase [Capsaspora owczarzaki ATCC 30864]KJE93659.1 CTD small phosphatase [Capsaspora owczarzaki ATCC 30864]|eukprot:XP_004348243.1 CTD small phosphatase [Capsaspora owczarzaki ATCC 30864]